ncbi:MAG: flagellar basal body protein, partial [Pseudomonadales bacterium]|nr:flagellar basal body protein [Pseudomonadales bacterium]
MASLFDIGINGLRAQQAALNVVGQNITNASTPGYTRQRADLVTQSGSLSGVNAGAGARLDQIVRVADTFVDQQIRTDSALKSEMESYAQFVGQLETTLFDGDFGVDTAVREFFDAVQDSANEPSDLAVRQFVISNADALASRFQGVTDRAWLQARDVSGS